MRITLAGNVGIGTTSPASKLDLTSASAGYIYTSFQSYSGATRWFAGSGNAGVSIQPYGITRNANGNNPDFMISDRGLVGIGVYNGSPDASAQLQVFSPNSDTGFLVPQLTDAQIRAISSPADGLMVYNYDIKNICFFLQGNWQQIQFTLM